MGFVRLGLVFGRVAINKITPISIEATPKMVTIGKILWLKGFAIDKGKPNVGTSIPPNSSIKPIALPIVFTYSLLSSWPLYRCHSS